MPVVEKISIALTPDMASLVRQAVEDGDYASSSEVIREALRDWKLKRAMQRDHIHAVRRLWQEGLDSGPAGELDVASIKTEARDRLRAGKATPPR